MISDVILSNLALNENYSRKVLAHLKPEYFTDQTDKILFDLVYSYTTKYNAPPSKEALTIDLENVSGLTEENYSSVKSKINEMQIEPTTNLDWLVTQTENYCQEKALYNAALEAISIIDGKDKAKSAGSIPDLFSKALSVSFTTAIGHDFTEDYAERYDYYHQSVSRIPFDLEYFNKITKGGLPRKTLTAFLSNRTGGGKSLTKCHMAASHLSQGYNVLYISAEMAEEEIAKRIDANLMNITLDDLEILPKDDYFKKARKIKEKTKGRLIIEEYPTSTAHVGHFRHLLHELKLKKNFIPDVIYVDYLNICASSRLKKANANSYEYIKSIAEELRALAVEQNCAIVTSTQGNRDALDSSDIDLSNTSESIGLPATLDLFIGIVRTEELDALGQLLFKQLKNRLGPEDVHRRFVVGVDRSKMMLYDLNDDAQKSFKSDSRNPEEDTPVMDRGDFGGKSKKNDSSKKFDNWS
ncbi:DNA primase/helicase [Caulobacter phage Cr30]|uniref:DNA primase/helicase n=1 Tax=Caulobacter phage Cr30 TaxID=1357714 RepID=UPI0004A9B511|nr:DNA primase/helicase [Caulobacter phage Cr30]AGS81158.1 DNA primase/helicase [Caulobacter phage Cr30]